ncbi:hypothetical protein [Pontiella sulfatireligans]|uniref:SLA1 homology domain-containing protein n=1 Tax=Pontiella sulfatireligans TaxID=2750658 RepID=A0A6C2UMQ6_9BACT|nr:hypothetical protein [Pontiella sulfatireligans]VGO20594.1 hypothetical protein SCARR_02659 [Pontiella sulfatireligans]
MMKLIGLIILATAATYADEAYRTFTAQDGRTLSARIVSYDAASGKVLIERADKKRITVAPTAFSAKDQRYVDAWQTAQHFLSTSKFKLDVVRKEVNSTKKEHEVDIGEEEAGGRRGGDSGVQTVAIDKITHYKFNLLIENKTKIPVKNLTMEYRIYYDQEKAVKDEKANKNRREDDPRPERYLSMEESKVKEGKLKIRAIEAGESKEFPTQSVSILKRSASRTWGDKIDLKGSLEGVWIKLSMQGPGRDKLVREIALPPSIPKKYSWDPVEEPEAVDESEEKEEPKE